VTTRVKTAVNCSWVDRWAACRCISIYTRSELNIVCDIIDERARSVAKRYGYAVTTSLDEVAASDAQVVSVATPDFAHYESMIADSRTSDTARVLTQMLSWAGQSGPQWFLFARTMHLVRWIIGLETKEAYAIGVKEALASRGTDAFDAIHATVRFDKSFATLETSWIPPEA
jgi:predicted dehydrogenase